MQGERKSSDLSTKTKVTNLACMYSGPPSWNTSTKTQPGFEPGSSELLSDAVTN